MFRDNDLLQKNDTEKVLPELTQGSEVIGRK